MNINLLSNIKKLVNNSKPKVITLEEGIDISTKLKNDNINIGITTGCFDIFHSGHIKSLKFASNKCDVLFLLLNSDESIKKLKGDNRPVNKLEYRLDLLLELNFIDYIIIFDEKDADSLLESLNFNIFFKGGDYDINILEEKFPNSQIILSEHIEGNSSSLIIERIKKNS